MDPIYVTGHQNPDTDSIVAAIAYASLRNALGDREYEAACLGRVSDETQVVLNHFGFQPPTLITNVYTQVKDLDYDTPPILSAAVTEERAWNILREQKGISAVPVANEDGTLYGMLSREDVAGYSMELTNACILEEVPLFNVLSVIEGKVLNDVGEYTDTIAGEVIIAIILGILIGQFMPEPVCRLVVTLSGFFSNFLKFVIPLMILAYVTMGIADLTQGAGKLLLITVAIAYCSTLIAGSDSKL